MNQDHGLKSRGLLARSSVVSIMLALVALAMATSAVAAPSRYDYEVCDSALPEGNTPGVHFVANPGVPLVGGNTCSQPGGSIQITQTGHVGGTYSFWTVPVETAPGTHIEQVTITASMCNAGPATIAFVYEQGFPGNCGAETTHTFHTGGGVFGGAGIFLGCNGNYPQGCDPPMSVYEHYIVAEEVDPKAPTLPTVEGSLLAPGIIRGHTRTLHAVARDEGGGVSKVYVSVNGEPVSTPVAPSCNTTRVNNPSLLGTVAVTPGPCPPTAEGDWTLDTTSPPFQTGSNTVAVCASDYSSLSEPNTTCSSSTITVDNSCVESQVAGGESVSAEFTRTHGDQVVEPFDRGATIDGAVRNGAGEGISGATVCVQTETPDVDPGLQPLTSVTTDSSGHFSYELPAGPNRRVLLGYHHDEFQVSHSINFHSHTRPKLRINREKVRAGGRIKMIGTIPGPNSGGRVAVFQASAPGSKRWYTFGKATANRNGVFRGKYRFDATTSTATYRIRVVVPHQANYPYEGGHSKAAKVKVTVGR
jgi:hypothetical protein